MPDPIWHVTIPAIALVRAPTAEDAEAMVVKALERFDFCAYEDDRHVFESEQGTPEDALSDWRGWMRTQGRGW